MISCFVMIMTQQNSAEQQSLAMLLSYVPSRILGEQSYSMLSK